MQRLFFILSMALFLFSCEDDDNSTQYKLTQEEQNKADDEAIVKLLDRYYFDAQGKLTAFDEDSEDDDDETPLKEFAIKDESGYWYAINPNITSTGPQVTSNKKDSILLQYDTSAFTASRNDNNELTFNVSNSAQNGALPNTINRSGFPTWDPVFYYKNVEGTSVPESYYVMEGFAEGIKHFKASNRAYDAQPPIQFQGALFIPSRLAFGRDQSKVINAPNISFIFNFELYKVIDRN